MFTITDLLGTQVLAQLQIADWEAEFQRQFFRPVALAERVRGKLEAPPGAPTEADERTQIMRLLATAKGNLNAPTLPTQQ